MTKSGPKSNAAVSNPDPNNGTEDNVALCKTILDNLMEGIWVSDCNDKITYLNSRMIQMLGPFSDNNPAGIDILDGFPPESLMTELIKHYQKAKQTLKPVRFENILLLMTDGSQRHYQGAMVPSAENSIFSGLICTINDCTEHKFLAEVEKNLQTRLIQANKANALSTLVSGIAHEVNNPNNSIALGGELLTKYWERIFALLDEIGDNPALDSQTSEDMADIRSTGARIIKGIGESARRIAGVINNLREYGGRKTDNSKELDINRLVSVCLSILHHHINKHTSRFRFEPAEQLIMVPGNSQQLMQVMINLIMNALQSLPNTECEVLVSTALAPDLKSVKISIMDSGRGIPADEITRIFEPFYTTRLANGGTGLGLAISQMIINEHGGTLDISSIPGAGTTALITLPAKAANGEHAHENR
jgi:PAS domain S-box-containing protein